ncbi:hypothetical protein ACQKWADRAFT_288193 [Trichoderma austrokoningii]
MVVQTRRRAAMQETPVKADSGTTEKSSAKSSPAPKLPVREEAATPTKGTLKVFDDEDEDEAETPLESSLNQASEAAEDKEEEEEADSDDEAPEAVSTIKAAEEIKKSAQVAQQAAKEQAATQKRKRQLRDELLKKQAEERKKADDAKEEASATKSQSKKPETSGRKRVQKANIPAVLPAEFLEDSSSEDEDDDAADAASGPKRRKVSGVEKRLTRLDAGPKDEVVNSTVYRVAKKTDERMAPKLKKHTKSSKDLLLKRNRPAVRSGTGFFKK